MEEKCVYFLISLIFYQFPFFTVWDDENYEIFIIYDFFMEYEKIFWFYMRDTKNDQTRRSEIFSWFFLNHHVFWSHAEARSCHGFEIILRVDF